MALKEQQIPMHGSDGGFGVRWGAQTEGALGVPASAVVPALQSDAFKELINKLAWALGSTYKAQYGNVHSPARAAAVRLAKMVIARHGYPRHISFDSLKDLDAAYQAARDQI